MTNTDIRSPDLERWQREHLQGLQARLKKIRSQTENLAQAYVTPHQGIFLHRRDTMIEMYCYEDATKTLSNVMSRIDLDDPLFLHSLYTQVIALSAIWPTRQIGAVYVAGFGGGILPTFFRHHFPHAQIDASDIDDHMMALAVDYFGFAEDDRMDIAFEDSRQHLARMDRLYDIVILDVFSESGQHADHLASVEFFHECKQKLSKGGVAVLNLTETDERYQAKLAALGDVFDHCLVWKHAAAKIAFATQAPMQIETLEARARQFAKTHEIVFPLAAHIDAMSILDIEDLPLPLRDASLTQ